MEAISEPNMVHLALFMQKVLNVLPTLQDLHGSQSLPPDDDSSLTPHVKEKLRVVVSAASHAANAHAAVGDAMGATVAASGDVRDVYTERCIRIRHSSSRALRTPVSSKRAGNSGGGGGGGGARAPNDFSPSLDMSSKSSIAFSEKSRLSSPRHARSNSGGEYHVEDGEEGGDALYLPQLSPSGSAMSGKEQGDFGSPPERPKLSPAVISALEEDDEDDDQQQHHQQHQEGEEPAEDMRYRGPRLSNYEGDDDELLRVRRSSDLFENVRTLKRTAHHVPKMNSLAPAVVERHRRELLRLPIYSIAPLNFYDINAGNLMDYELPPGCVTIRVVKIIVELFRKGGRLTPNSVRKLLRLGYKSLKPRPNTTRISLSPGEKLTVVGDLHGAYAVHCSIC